MDGITKAIRYYFALQSDSVAERFNYSATTRALLQWTVRRPRQLGVKRPSGQSNQLNLDSLRARDFVAEIRSATTVVASWVSMCTVGGLL